jgi:hypothetical protein
MKPPLSEGSFWGIANSKWAVFGKITAPLLAVLTIFSLVIQIHDRFSGPALTVTMEVRNTAPGKDYRFFLTALKLKWQLVHDIEALKAAGKTPEQILTQINADLQPLDDGDLMKVTKADIAARGLVPVNYFAISNDTDAVAENVQLVLSGTGTAIISETSYLGLDAPPVDWSGRIQLGDMLPGSKKFVWVWSDERLGQFYYGPRPTVVFKNGFARVRFYYLFGGWPAEISFWFNSQPSSLRYTCGVGAIVVLVVGFLTLRRRKKASR